MYNQIQVKLSNSYDMFFLQLLIENLSICIYQNVKGLSNVKLNLRLCFLWLKALILNAYSTEKQHSS